MEEEKFTILDCIKEIQFKSQIAMSGGTDRSEILKKVLDPFNSPNVCLSFIELTFDPVYLNVIFMSFKLKKKDGQCKAKFNLTLFDMNDTPFPTPHSFEGPSHNHFLPVYLPDIKKCTISVPEDAACNIYFSHISLLPRSEKEKDLSRKNRSLTYQTEEQKKKNRVLEDKIKELEKELEKSKAIVDKSQALALQILPLGVSPEKKQETIKPEFPSPKKITKGPLDRKSLNNSQYFSGTTFDSPKSMTRFDDTSLILSKEGTKKSNIEICYVMTGSSEYYAFYIIKCGEYAAIIDSGICLERNLEKIETMLKNYLSDVNYLEYYETHDHEDHRYVHEKSQVLKELLSEKNGRVIMRPKFEPLPKITETLLKSSTFFKSEKNGYDGMVPLVNLLLSDEATIKQWDVDDLLVKREGISYENKIKEFLSLKTPDDLKKYYEGRKKMNILEDLKDKSEEYKSKIDLILSLIKPKKDEYDSKVNSDHDKFVTKTCKDRGFNFHPDFTKEDGESLGNSIAILKRPRIEEEEEEEEEEERPQFKCPFDITLFIPKPCYEPLEKNANSIGVLFSFSQHSSDTKSSVSHAQSSSFKSFSLSIREGEDLSSTVRKRTLTPIDQPFTAFFTGDMEYFKYKKSTKILDSDSIFGKGYFEKFGASDTNFFVVPHHGSSKSTYTDFYKCIGGGVMSVPCGTGTTNFRFQWNKNSRRDVFRALRRRGCVELGAIVAKYNLQAYQTYKDTKVMKLQEDIEGELYHSLSRVPSIVYVHNYDKDSGVRSTVIHKFEKFTAEIRKYYSDIFNIIMSIVGIFFESGLSDKEEDDLLKLWLEIYYEKKFSFSSTKWKWDDMTKINMEWAKFLKSGKLNDEEEKTLVESLISPTCKLYTDTHGKETDSSSMIEKFKEHVKNFERAMLACIWLISIYEYEFKTQPKNFSPEEIIQICEENCRKYYGKCMEHSSLTSLFHVHTFNSLHLREITMKGDNIGLCKFTWTLQEEKYEQVGGEILQRLRGMDSHRNEIEEWGKCTGEKKEDRLMSASNVVPSSPSSITTHKIKYHSSHVITVEPVEQKEIHNSICESGDIFHSFCASGITSSGITDEFQSVGSSSGIAQSPLNGAPFENEDESEKSE
ncbi:hypothetical protein ADUPG1_008127 [Aduncisulcus paluster]|uniref:Uncharacterized protein n=1 Tax=Aduncisulcus paluster TaxID=2918883 RepID=A0ABQ5KS68_9EUKA|nr:hypothetical protein ADUPG1_008127 [Aduncisulcus paluster]